MPAGRVLSGKRAGVFSDPDILSKRPTIFSSLPCLPLLYQNVCLVSTCQDLSGSESLQEPEYKEEGWKDQG